MSQQNQNNLNTQKIPQEIPQNISQQQNKDKEKYQLKLSKQYKKKQARQKLQQENKQQQQEEIEADPFNSNYGEQDVIQSQYKTNRKWTEIEKINENQIGQTVLIRARQNQYTIQTIAAINQEYVSKTMIKFIFKVPQESVVDITGKIVKAEVKSKNITQNQIEIIIQTFFVVSKSKPYLPFSIQDASIEQKYLEQNFNKQIEQPFYISQKLRLDNRILDLRTPAKLAIFKIQSGICKFFREFLIKNDFMEIHTPKLTQISLQSQYYAFNLKYQKQKAQLSQSPQIYTQMCIMADFKRIFEIGPCFRAHLNTTHKQLAEFTRLDLEMEIKENWHEALDMMAGMFVHIFKGLENEYKKELEAINKQYEFEPFVIKEPVLKLDLKEGVKMLKEAGIEQDPLEDLSTETEKKLGGLVKQKYGTDFYMLIGYPKSARPFYTMLKHDDPNYTLSYDFFMRGEEITSGAQRNHNPDSLRERAIECGIDPETLKSYIDSFSYGAVPHAGCGIGLERVVFLYCNMKNIRNSSLFPRDPTRIYP